MNWINVSEQLPNVDGLCSAPVLATDGEETQVCRYYPKYQGAGKKPAWEYTGMWEMAATHWMPLPKLPNTMMSNIGALPDARKTETR
jgi:hypothetical protein